MSFLYKKEWTSSVKDIGDSDHHLRLKNLLWTGCHTHTHTHTHTHIYIYIYIYIYICIHVYNGLGWLNRYSYSLRSRRSGDGIPVGARFFTPVKIGPGAHPASYTMSLSRGLIGCGGHSPPTPSSAEAKKRVELHLTPPLGLRGLF